MGRVTTRIPACAMIAVISVLPVGCSDQRAREDLPAILKVGILPGESKERLLERYEPLRKHLSDSLGLPCQLIVSDSYGALVESFGAGTVDLAYFGGLTFVRAMVSHGAVPLVMRDVDTRFTSYFVVRADSEATRIDDCEGQVFAFGSKLSTSGHLMPRHYLSSKDITPENFFSETRYSGAHDTTVDWVRDGTVDIGAVNAPLFRAMAADGRIDKEYFRIVCETRPYTGYVWAVQPNLGRAGRQKLRDAFLELSPDREEHEEILRNMDAGGFLPANADAFSGLKEIASNMELLQ